MDVLPSQSEVFLLSEEDQKVTPDQTVPAKVFEAMQFVEEAMRQGFAVQVIALRHELPIDEAAGAIRMGADDLRAYAADGRSRSGRLNTPTGCGWPTYSRWTNGCASSAGLLSTRC